MPLGPSQFDEQLSRLDEEIRQMKIEFDRFFNGALPIPPEELRTKVQGQLRRLRKRRLPYLVDRFRLNGLEARFNSLNELFNRRIREHELGEISAASRAEAYAGVVFGERGTREQAQILYEELYGAGGRSKKTDFGTFYQFLERKASKIRKLTGCPQVQFRITESEGRLALKAKPMRTG